MPQRKQGSQNSLPTHEHEAPPSPPRAKSGLSHSSAVSGERLGLREGGRKESWNGFGADGCRHVRWKGTDASC
jgi:hypothetical protein